MKVAAVQFAPKLKDRQENLTAAVILASRAAQAGAKLIVLPELCLTGYSFMSYEEARPYAEDIEEWPNGWSKSNPPSSLIAMRELTSKYGCAIAWGLVTISGANRTNQLHNSQVLMLPDGSITTYNKVNLWGNDFLWSTSGKQSPPIVKFGGKKIGLLICRDVRDRSSGFKDFYEKGDADIVAFSSNFGDGGFPSTSWMDFAKENRTTFVVSNRYGREGANNFGEGGICIIEPPSEGREYGRVHCEGLKWGEPCIVYAEVP
jgi:predicted amidohydrolase